jgi:hypothetical protein
MTIKKRENKLTTIKLNLNATDAAVVVMSLIASGAPDSTIDAIREQMSPQIDNILLSDEVAPSYTITDESVMGNHNQVGACVFDDKESALEHLFIHAEHVGTAYMQETGAGRQLFREASFTLNLNPEFHG